jgi:hypothetical protein
MPWSSGCPKQDKDKDPKCKHGNGTASSVTGCTMEDSGDTFVKDGYSATIYECSVCSCRYSTHSDFGE